MTTLKSPETHDRQLRRNTMSVGHIVFFVVAAAAPLTVVGSLFTVIIGIGNGAGIAGAFLVVSIILAIFAVGYVAMSRHIVDAGDFYAYVSIGIGKPLGLGAAGLAIFAYTAIQLGVYGALGYYADAFVSAHTAVDLPWWVYTLLAMAITLVLGVRRIDLGARVLGLLLILESIAIVIVDIAIIVKGGGSSFRISPITPAATFSGAVGVAVMFAHASFIGFESTAIYGEETHDPVKAVPRATYIAVAFLGIFYTITAWLVINAFASDDAAVASAQQDPENFFFNISDRFAGGGVTTLLTLLIVTSMFAAVVAFHNNVARYLFALGRQGILWGRMGSTHRTRQSPHIACYVQTAIAFVVVLIFAVLGRDPFLELFTWLTGIGAVGIIMLQTMAAVAIIAFFRRRALDKRLWNTVIAPILALAGLLTLLYFAFKNFNTLVGAKGPIAVTLLLCLFVSLLIGVVAALIARQRRPDVYARLGARLNAVVDTASSEEARLLAPGSEHHS